MTNAPTVATPLLTLANLAERYGKSPQAIYNMRTRGQGPRATRIGRSLRFRVEDVLAWEAAQVEDAR